MAVVVDGRAGAHRVPGARARSTRRPSWPCSSAGCRPAAPTRSASTWPPIGHPLVGDPTYGERRPTLGLDAPVPPRRRAGVRPPGDGRAAHVHQPAAPDLARRPRRPRRRADRSDGSALGGRTAVGRAARRPVRRPRARRRGPSSAIVGQRVAVEVVAHVLAGLVPDREQHALALVVAGAVLVGLAEVAERDRAVDGRHDLRQADLGRVAGEHVAAADAALGAHQPGALRASRICSR